MSNKNKVYSVLKSEKQSLASGASLYQTLMLKNNYSLTTEEFEDRREHHTGLLSEVSHIEQKMNRDSCLSCERVLECTFKNQCKVI